MAASERAGVRPMRGGERINWGAAQMMFFVVPICVALITAIAFAAICRYALARSWAVTLASGFGLFIFGLSLELAVLSFVSPHAMR
jgi:hypothetical protein